MDKQENKQIIEIVTDSIKMIRYFQTSISLGCDNPEIAEGLKCAKLAIYHALNKDLGIVCSFLSNEFNTSKEKIAEFYADVI